MGIPDHLTCLLRNLYAGQEATVTTGHGTDWFQIGKRVCQGCILSLCLFNFYAEYIMRNTGLEEVQAGIKITGRNINNFRYADDQRRQRHPTPAFFPGKSNGRRSLVGCSPWGRWESDKTQRLHFHFSLSCIGEGNGNPLKCSCLENPREPGGLPSMGSHRVGHDWSDLAAAAAACRWHNPYGRKWRRTQKPLDESERGEW